MASQTRPLLMTGAALASAATLVVATPAIAPSLSAAPITVASGDYDLATFADVFTIPSGVWVDSYFKGYGNIVSPNNPFPLEPYASTCNGGCVTYGLSALAYLGLDALINGNGNGWADNANWGVSAVNYFFEPEWNFGQGLSAGTQYLLQTSVGAANPVLSVAITLFFAGPELLSVVYVNALQLLSEAALNLPAVGDYVYGGINAYLGPLSLNPDYWDYGTFFQQQFGADFSGLSGVLEYALDVLTGQAPPPPAEAVEAAESVAAASAAAVVGSAAAATEVTAEQEPVAAEPAADETESAAAAETDSPAEVATPSDADTEAVDVAVETTVSADTPTVEADTEAATDTEAAADTEASTDITASTGAEATETDTAAVSVADVKAQTAEAGEAKPAKDDSPTKSTSKRPVRDAVAKVASALGIGRGAAASTAAEGRDSADSDN